MKTHIILAAAATLALSGAAFAKGDLTLKPTELPELKLGLGDAGYGVSQKSYELETGKAYSLELSSTGKKECAWQAPGFFQSIFLRKVEVEEVEVKAIGLTEIEFEQDGEAELFFVPIKPGTYPWFCKGMEERGMKGEFIVK
ncbi:copper-binding protein [Starkeya koreensis]|uniref:Copper-binding protein n=1 Tax=Ancylobacter koreensis TaxID=266121 RepID=A0ABT0DNC5_9HYPH|nr:copper-binding protein [Ancylobacter koreensis]MCK0208699.1 copper-binding protein [Ancylobacter koreensis]